MEGDSKVNAQISQLIFILFALHIKREQNRTGSHFQHHSEKFDREAWWRNLTFKMILAADEISNAA